MVFVQGKDCEGGGLFLTEKRQGSSASRLRLPIIGSALHDINFELLLYGLDLIDLEHALNTIESSGS